MWVTFLKIEACCIHFAHIDGHGCDIFQGTDQELGAGSIHKLLEAVDSWIPLPQRILDKPLLFPVESTYSISGRGTVVTGQVERGVVRKGEEVEFIGYKSKIKTIVTGVCVCVFCVLVVLLAHVCVWCTCLCTHEFIVCMNLFMHTCVSATIDCMCVCTCVCMHTVFVCVFACMHAASIS